MNLRTAFAPYARDIDEKRLDVLDGVRVLFVFFVAWFHIWQQSWLSPSFTLFSVPVSLDFLPRTGYIFVDGMLLLSGLLLYYPVAGAADRAPDFLRFYKKRLVRIFPSYALCIVVMLLFSALPQKAYPTFEAGLKDVLAHLTFTHNFFPFSYQATPLNGALWTLAVEMQFYLIFPLLARAFKKQPLITFLCMTCAAFGYRAYVATLPDTAMYINQLPAFLDVYAIGFAAAALIKAFRERFKNETRSEKLFFTVLSVLMVCLLVPLLQTQAAQNGYEAIRLGQLSSRFTLAVILAVLMVCLCFSLPVVRFLFGNRLMRFLSAVSFQYYIWHQVFAVKLKSLGIPPALNAEPWRMGEKAWQYPYTLLCFLGALFIAILVTYLFEKPVAQALRKHRLKGTYAKAG